MNIDYGKLRVLLQAMLLGAFASLGACSNDDGPRDVPPFNDPNATMTIETFGVTGNADVVSGVVQIEPKSSTKTGLFTVGWTVKGNNTYTARVYISADNVRDSADIKIHEGCGKIAATDTCRSNALPACTFEHININTNTISCATPSGSPLVVDVTAVIPIVIPIVTPRTSVPAYIIMEACNPNLTCFPTSLAQAIRVRFY